MMTTGQAKDETCAVGPIAEDRAVTDVYTSVKLLENRYIDLANFYKDLY